MLVERRSRIVAAPSVVADREHDLDGDAGALRVADREVVGEEIDDRLQLFGGRTPGRRPPAGSRRRQVVEDRLDRPLAVAGDDGAMRFVPG